jgi:hypothetical protein
MYENVDMPDSQGVYIEKHLNLFLRTLHVTAFKFVQIYRNLGENTVEGLVGKKNYRSLELGVIGLHTIFSG